MLGPLSDRFWKFRCGFAQGILQRAKSEQNMRVLQHFQKRWQRGTFEEDLERGITRGRGSTRDMFIRDVRWSGRQFPERGCILEHQIFRFAKMIVRDRCSTSSDLASLLPGKCSTLHRWSGKSQNALVRGRQLCTQLSMKEVSQNCFVFDVVNFENWGRLADMFRFWCCQVKKMEDVSQNCFVFDFDKFKNWGCLEELLFFDVVKFKNWGSLAELLPFQACRLQIDR